MDKKLTRNMSLLMLVSIVGANMSFAASNFKYQQNIFDHIMNIF